MKTLFPLAAATAWLSLSGAGMAQEGSPQGLSCQQLVEALASDGRVALQGVSFDFNRATLRPDSLPAMIAARDAIMTLGGAWGIEGHTDAVGSRAYNQTLSEARAGAVRDWLVASGIEPGQLNAQGFSLDRPVADNATEEGRALNRRVELVGSVTPDMLGFGGPEGVDPCPATLIPGTAEAPPPIPDWSGAGGQEWLPFSYLMATGDGAASGWEGARIEMPPGSRPEACQALCTQNSDCAAFSFEPAGSFFVENARCALVGYGTGLSLTRDNSYLDGGTFFVSGLKPDARLLTPESEALADEIIADLAEIARLRETVRLAAPMSHPAETPMDLALEGAVPGDAYPSYVEIAEPGDLYDWSLSRGSVFVHDMEGMRGQITTPAPGDYVLRYVIDHPRAGRHLIAEQSLAVGPMDEAAAPAAPSGTQTASLSFPMVVAPGEAVPVTYQGPLHAGDWLDIVGMGQDDDMSGGWSWAYAEGGPVTLTAPGEAGEYMLRYVAEDPSQGRVVLAQDALVVRAPDIAAPDLFQTCEGTDGATCDLPLPGGALLTLASGYGITEPLILETAAGVAAERASFDVVRLSDGAAVMMVNVRQASDVYCMDGLAGDRICLTPDFADGDGMAAGLVFASLAGPAPEATEDEAPEIAAGDLQGIWVFSIDMPGRADDQAPFLMAELMQDAGAAVLEGTFVGAPDLGPLPGSSGDLAGMADEGRLGLTMAGADGATGLIFTGEAYGADAYRGTLIQSHAPLEPATAAILRRIAGPGEAWDGPAWMTGAPDGMEAALQMGQQALQDILGDLQGEERAVAEMLGQVMGAMGGAAPSAPEATPSAEMTALEGIPIEGLGAGEALILLAPHLEE